MTDFAMVPDHGPPRLIRMVMPDAMPSTDCVCALDRKNNLLLVNIHLFEQLDESERNRVLRTREPYLTM